MAPKLLCSYWGFVRLSTDLVPIVVFEVRFRCQAMKKNAPPKEFKKGSGKVRVVYEPFDSSDAIKRILEAREKETTDMAKEGAVKSSKEGRITVPVKFSGKTVGSLTYDNGVITYSFSNPEVEKIIKAYMQAPQEFLAHCVERYKGKASDSLFFFQRFCLNMHHIGFEATHPSWYADEPC